MFLLMGPPEVASGLDGAGLAADLRSGGARSIQVNVVDPDLGPPFGVPPDAEVEQVAAVVSAWVDAAEGTRVGSALPDSSRWHGYLVSESEPLPNTTRPPAANGLVPGFSQIVVLSRPARLSWTEWRRIWQRDHTSIATHTQSIFRFVQNVIFRPLTSRAPQFAAVGEECFPSDAASDLHVYFDAVGDEAKLARHMAAMAESCDRFMDGVAPVAWTTAYVL
jgi:EthD domain